MKLNEQDISRIFQARAGGLSSEQLADVLQGRAVGAAELDSFDQTDLAAMRLNNDLRPWTDQLADRLDEARHRQSWFDRLGAWLSPAGSGGLTRLVPIGAAAAVVLTVAVVTQMGPAVPVAGTVSTTIEDDSVLFGASFESIASTEVISQSGFEAPNTSQLRTGVLFEGGFESTDQVFAGSFEAANI